MQSQPQKQREPADVRFVAFFLVWAAVMNWKVPAIHIRACIWLATCGDLAVLRCFRGFGKSTILAIYNAWRYYESAQYRILHQGDKDPTAYKTSRDTKRVLRKHPWTKHLFAIKGESAFWWVPGADDERNPSMQAAGILSSITSSRADEIQNDDVEVPKNIKTPEARETLRYRLGEQTHILVPGGRKLYIGTPHTHDSLYDEQERLGADCLTIKMFEFEYRIEVCTENKYRIKFNPEMVFSGIGEGVKTLVEGEHYQYVDGWIIFKNPTNTLVDCYAGSAWPERFTMKEMEKRRKETKTINEWDSQYQLHSKPITQIRLDPEKLVPYDVEPKIRIANKIASLWLGDVRIVSMSFRWDPSSAKANSDDSTIALLMQDEYGRRYIHRTVSLEGEVAKFTEDGRKIIGGQVYQICDLVQQFNVPRIVIETNGIGGFAPSVLKAALKQRKLTCGVTEENAVINKQKRILEAIEGPLSSNMLWAHTSVIDGPAWDQMKDFNPAVNNQTDDHIDAIAGAITDTPERLNIKISEVPEANHIQRNWRPNSGTFEVELER